MLDVSRCPGFTLDFTSGAAAGFCGETRDVAGNILQNLRCGGLYIGGGHSGLGEGLTPDGSTNRFHAFCTDTVCQLQASSAKPPANTADPDCTDVGCNFGPPLPIFNPTTPPLSVCVLNTLKEPAGGEIDRTTGEATINISLSSTTYVTGPPLCPRCSASGSPASPGVGTCDSGPNGGKPCTSTNSAGLTRDCPPTGPPLQRPISVVLSPLVTAERTMSNPDGKFCENQGDAPGNNGTIFGCFGNPQCRSITERGTLGGPLLENTPTLATLASVFCIPMTGDGGVDGAADLPGPGALSLPGQFLLTAFADAPTTSSTAASQTTRCAP